MDRQVTVFLDRLGHDVVLFGILDDPTDGVLGDVCLEVDDDLDWFDSAVSLRRAGSNHDLPEFGVLCFPARE